MSTIEFFNQLLISESEPFSVSEVFLAIVIPLCCSFIIAFTYKKTQYVQSHSINFLHSLVIFCILASILSMVIGNNIARAFGLIGALSIVRFRNAVKSPLDATYIFWALTVGMAAGIGHYFVSISISVVCSLILFVLDKINFGKITDYVSILKVTYTLDIDDSELANLEKALYQKVKQVHKLNSFINFDKKEKIVSYSINLKSPLEFHQLMNWLKKQNSVQNVQSLGMESQLFLPQ